MPSDSMDADEKLRGSASDTPPAASMAGLASDESESAPLPEPTMVLHDIEAVEETRVLHDIEPVEETGELGDVEEMRVLDDIESIDELDDAELDDAGIGDTVTPLPPAPTGRPQAAAPAIPRPPPPRMPPPRPPAPPAPPFARERLTPAAGTPAPPPFARERLTPAAGVPVPVMPGRERSGPVTAPPLRERSGPLLIPTGSGPVAVPAAPEPPDIAVATPTPLDRALASLGEQAFTQRAELLARRLESSADPDVIAAAAHELGELCERRLGDQARAVKAYDQALKTDPSLRANLWAIRRIVYRKGLWPNLIKLIDAEIDYAQSDEERADLIIEKGTILEDRMGEAEGARAAYEAALDLVVPGTESRAALPALMSLERLALGARDESALERIWERTAEAATAPELKLVYLLDLARLREQRGDLEQALDTLSEAVALGVDRGRVVRERLRVAERSGDADSTLSALDACVAHERDVLGQDPSEAARMAVVALHRRQAHMAIQLAAERPEERETLHGRAAHALEHALELVPEEPLVLVQAADVAAGLGQHERAAALLGRAEAREPEPGRRLALGVRRARALLGAGKDDEAAALLAELGAAAPGHVTLTALGERIALAHRDFAALARVYLDAAAAAEAGTALGPGPARTTEPDRNATDEPRGDAAQPRDRVWAASLYVAAAELLARDAGDADAAARAYERALAAVPGHGPALEGLCELHVSRGEPAQAAAILEQRLAAAGELARPLLERLVRILDDMGEPGRAHDADARLLALSPDDTDSARVRWRMQARLVALGRHAEAVDVLSALAEDAPDPERRGVALQAAARLCEHALGDAARAADLYRDILEIWPGDRYARAARALLVRRAGRWDELVAERRAEAAELGDGPALAQALREAALVLGRELGRPDEAAEVYRALLDRMPGDPGALRGLAELLAGVEQSRGEVPAELIDVLEQESTADGPAEARGLAALRLGSAHERAGRPEEALDAYRRAAELLPASALPGVAMAELAATSGDDFALIDASNQLAHGRGDEHVRAEILEDVGWLWASAAEDMDRASDALDEAARLDPGRPGPLLGKLLVDARRGDAHATAETLVRLAGAVQAPGAASAMLLRAAAVAAAEGNGDAVAERLFGALSRAPQDLSTLMVAAEYAAVTPADEPVTAEQLEGRAELFALRIEHAGSPSSRLDWELLRAEALEGAGRLREAARIATDIANARPDSVRALELLRRVCRKGGDRAGLARASLALARALSDPEAACELLREAAIITDAELGDAPGAAAIYRRILELAPGADELGRLLDIAREAKDARTLYEIITARLGWLGAQARGGDAGALAAQVPLLLERASLRQELGDARGAVRDLAALLAIDPRHTAALEAQARTLAAAGDSRAAAELYGRYLEVETDPQKRADAELALSRILAEDMDDVAGAIGQLDSVLSLSPDDTGVRERLVKLLGRAGDWERSLTEIAAIAARRATPAEKARDELRAAEIARDRLGDTARARAALERARALDPLSLDVVRQLAELLGDRDADRREVLGAAARDVHAAIVKSPAEARLHERLAAVHGLAGDRDGQYYALAAVSILGTLPSDKKSLVTTQAAALAAAPLPTATIAADDWERVVSAPMADDVRAVGEIWRAVAEAVAEIQGLEPGKLGFGRGDKTSGRAVAKRFPTLAALLDGFGVSGAELYIAESKPGFARALGASKPVLCLGADVAAAGSAESRFLLGRALAHARQGTGGLAELGEHDVSVLVAAAAHAAGLTRLPGALAGIHDQHATEVAERSKALQKALGWLERRGLGQMFERIAAPGDPAAWRRAALYTGARVGLLFAGDASAAMAALDIGRGRAAAGDPVALDLLTWMTSPEHLALRRTLGMASST